LQSLTHLAFTFHQLLIFCFISKCIHFTY
jgi:hypothetical protein